MKFAFDGMSCIFVWKSGTPLLSQWQNWGLILGSLASGSMILIALFFSLLYTATQKYSVKIKQQRQKYKHTHRT